MPKVKQMTTNLHIRVLLFAVAFLFILYFLFGIHWEETMCYYASSIYGNFSSPPFDAYITEVFMFYIPILGYVSVWFPKIPVAGIWFLFLQFLWIATWIYILMNKFQFPISNYVQQQTLILLIVFCIGGSSLIYIYPSRLSILLVSGSVLAFYENYKKKGKEAGLFLLLFILGTTVRLLMSFVTLSVLSVGILIEQRSIKKAFKILWIHWLITIVLLMFFLIFKYTSSNKALTSEEYYESSLTTKNAIVPLSMMKTAKDSIKYIAIVDFFLVTDTAQMNIGFINQILDKRKSFYGFINTGGFAIVKKQLLPIIEVYRIEIVFCYFLLFILFEFFQRSGATSIFVLHILSWIIIVLLSMKQINERFFVPWFSMIILSSIYFMADRTVFSFPKRVFIFVTLISGALFTFLFLRNISIEENENNRKAYVCLNKIKILSKKTTPVIWDYSGKYFVSDVLSRSETNVLSDCLFQTMPQFLFYKFGQERSKELFNFSPLDWKNMGSKFIEHNKKFSFIMGEKLSKFLPEYFKNVYNINLILIKDLPETKIEKDVFVFHIEKES